MKPTFFKSLTDRFESMWGIQREFRLKVLLLTTSFFMLTACQAIWRPLKSAIFISIVGVKSIPMAKMLLMIPMLLLIFIYSKLVDWFRRHQIFYWFAISHAIGGIVVYFFLCHPAYGLQNTTQSSGRLFGWFYYFFMESFGAFMSAVFWSFANSINKPNDAKNYYSLFVGGSKIGGVLGAGTLLIFLSMNFKLNDTVIIPRFILAGSLLLFAAATAIFLLMKYVPGYFMHGYEAAYRFEKQKRKTELQKEKIKKSFFENTKESLYKIVEGLWLIISKPYVFGIFGIILSYETIIVIVDYLVALAAASKHSTAGGLASYYASYYLAMHAVGILIALFGTAPIQRFLGIRLSLFACPIASTAILIVSLMFPSTEVLFVSLVLLRALNYALNHPTREALFIPTTKAIKFKAKVWTDAFGSRVSKASGSFLNEFVLRGISQVSTIFALSLTSIWVVIAFYLGKRFQKAVDNDEVIGAKK